ncbi:MAG: 16S rRNA (cytidine(1402)-2'-O)-methyltransferase [Gammaproteobacteria bacterium]|nr:16S rRNA (cytidine(1402)-2'-O)-methyltransferase [Gammaproteobacteria bacterium]MBQ0838266.1 16S rRNA (cytidine(1402)-2'-O)-methyltransferase [Gammaproteobacteria bacterium]
MTGTLYVVATPIGNMGDISARAIEVLTAVDLIAAEDTRHSGRLLGHFQITTPLVAYHDHGAEAQGERIFAALDAGKDVALISDAGTPLVSDPGYRLVRSARLKAYKVVPLPGACAAITALSAAGLPSDRFCFEGFLPAKQSQRRKALEGLLTETRTLIFYEAPHRIVATLDDLCEVFGAAREVTLARELSKTYETILSGSLGELVLQVSSDPNQQKGEMVLVVRGFDGVVESAQAMEEQRVLSLLLADLPVKQAATLAAKITGGQRNALYKMALALKQDSQAGA